MQKYVRYKHSVFVDKKMESHFESHQINKFLKRYLVRTELPIVSQGITEYVQKPIKDCSSNLDHRMRKVSNLR